MKIVFNLVFGFEVLLFITALVLGVLPMRDRKERETDILAAFVFLAVICVTVLIKGAV